MSENNFEKQQQELVDSFKKQLQLVADNIISEFYTDVTPYAETDATINFTNKIRDEIYEEIVHEIKAKHGPYSWAHSIRMALLKQHKEELQNKIIEDLQEKVKISDERYYSLCKSLS